MEISIKQTPEPLPPEKGKKATYEDVTAWGVDTRKALRECNGDKKDIEKTINEFANHEDAGKRD